MEVLTAVPRPDNAVLSRNGKQCASRSAEGTTKKLSKEIESLRGELMVLEEEEQRIQAARKIEAEKQEQLRRRRAQQEEEVNIRELIELRKVQEEQRKERLKRMREQAKQQEIKRLKKEKEHQQVQWDLAMGQPHTHREDPVQSTHKILDEASVESRQRLAVTLDIMKQELANLSHPDWVKKAALDQADVLAESRNQARLRQLKEKETQAQHTAIVKHASEQRDDAADDLITLKDELRMLEREEELYNVRREATTIHKKEVAVVCREQQEAVFEKQRQRQAVSEEVAVGNDEHTMSAKIDTQEYVLQRQARQREVVMEQHEKRVVEIENDIVQQDEIKSRMVGWGGGDDDEDCRRDDGAQPVLDLRALREEEQRLFEEQLRSEADTFQAELMHIGMASPEPITSFNTEVITPIRDLVQQQQTRTDIPLEAIIKYSAEMAGIHAQLASDEIDESRKKLQTLREEQTYHREKGTTLKHKADKLREEEEGRKLRLKKIEDENERQAKKERDKINYEKSMAMAVGEVEGIREESKRCRERLGELEVESAAYEEETAMRREEELENAIRREECRLVDAAAAKRRAAETTSMLRKASTELEKDTTPTIPPPTLEQQHTAAATIQGLHRMRQARGEATSRREARAVQSETDKAVLASQTAYRQKEALSSVTAKREEVRRAREAKARELLQQLEAAEDATQEAVREEIRQEIELLQTPSEVSPASSIVEEPVEQQVVAPCFPVGNPDDKLADLENRVMFLERKLEDERANHLGREQERVQLIDAARQREVSALADEKELQSRQVDELNELLQDHGALIAELQLQLERATRYGPYEEDWERGEAAVAIQAVYKGHRVRREMRDDKKREEEERVASAVRNEAAVAIQGMLRTTAAKKLKVQLGEERSTTHLTDVTEEAATNIQRVWRGAVVREQLQGTEV